MTIENCEKITLSLLRKHGLLNKGWKFSSNNTKTIIGRCNFRKKEILISENFIPLVSDEEIKDTILHEIAHALVGKEHHHNSIWKQKAIEIGCSGERIYKGNIYANSKYKGICPNCGKTIFRHRRRKMSCGKCDTKYNENYLCVWELNN